MDPVSFSVRNPVTVLVGVILVVMFGLIGLSRMPYQLSPDVTEPEITVETTWPGATPYEVERDIIEEQEDVLKGIPRLREMVSESYNSLGTITLRFEVGTEIDNALLRVSNKLEEVPEYPDTADKPIILATGANTSPVIWTLLRPREGNERDIATYKTFFENDVRQYLERVPGVADLFIGGGTEREMHVIVDPVKLAAHNLTIGKLSSILRAENSNVAAGNMDLGRRDYRIRTTGDFQSPEDILSVVVDSTGQRRITVGDLGTVRFGFEKKDTAMLHNGEPAMVVGIKPEPGANVLSMTNAAEKVVKELNDGILKDNDVKLDWVYDQRPYINGAIDLVQRNILIGAILAAIVLLLFLRSITATVIVGVAIPISVIGSFIFLNALGRNLNVVSMAGISFAVGMLVDNAIVVLENVDRHRSMGKAAHRAAIDGTREVWGAVLASTLTTVAVFLPVVFIEEEAGQLFKDIAIAVTCAISLSLFVSISVIPMLSSFLFRLAGKKGGGEKNGKPRIGPVDRAGELLVSGISGLVSLAIRTPLSRIATMVLLTSLAVGLTVGLFPKMEYLPQGNRNLIINVLVPPPGLSYEERSQIGHSIFDMAGPYFGEPKDGFPAIKQMFFVSGTQFNICGAIARDESRAAELIPLFNRFLGSIPGIFGVSIQASIFEQGIGQGRTISIDVSGQSIESIAQGAGGLFGMVQKSIPGAQVRPVPSLELLYPEVVFEPLRDRVRAAGLSTSELGQAVDVLMDGRQISEFREVGQKTIDLVLKASQEDVPTPEALYDQLVATPEGRAVPLSSLASIKRDYGISQIRHFERRRTITLQVTPPREMALQAAMETIQDEIVPQARQTGMLEGLRVSLSGAADKLTTTRVALQDNFLLALAITYLLMSALFGNFIYPFIILFTVPLAAAGGFLGLWLQNAFLKPQPMDIVTMLGFIILVGVVVNNAILIVHQALNNLRDHGMDRRQAVMESVRTRLRPIYMSAATSIFGMLPLALAPGPGSELYRGLGAVVLGGLALSTVFTVFVIPSLLMFFIRMEKQPDAEE
ncbi:efflux RND transporter permease subunit [Desulfohalovibrio reitneri]|uniref:efflux RND transporter permease subunit n=1 Tax=Desulfohalovibrio reitneri TaxID=1307759 RepID=UPI0004A73D04|nr:efflux RND transporter permease subunit [Desulfohalovibrio reitneri]